MADSPYDGVASGSSPVTTPASTSLSVVVSFEPSNLSGLTNFLQRLADPASASYHQFLSSQEFDARFGAPVGAYEAAVAYFTSGGATSVTTHDDRLTLSFNASVPVLEALFHTEIGEFSRAGATYYADTSGISLPRTLAAAVSEVTGLGTFSKILVTTDLGAARLARPAGSLAPDVGNVGGYLAPATVDGIQFEYAPDFQVAYNEAPLFNASGYPTSSDIATILWAGTYTGSTGTTGCGYLVDGQDVGPFVPSDIYDYYNETLPSGQPHALLEAVPIDGAAAPGIAASCDSTGAQDENTLDLEMVGSTAPGATIFNVYGPEPTFADLEAAFADILSPPSSFSASVRSGLDNVSVISNSWGSSEVNDTAWFEDLEEAQARGISVLASSGDSDDNTHSSKYWGSTVAFPASMAYNDFGDTAVGGTTVQLNSATLQLTSEVAWNISASDTSDGGPAGSTGGISSIFSEPAWQADTEANDVIAGGGRGVPDIAAVANNTLGTLSINGVEYKASDATYGGEFYYFWGTSISSPLTAGMIAEIDHALQASGEPRVGFLNPLAYDFASAAYLGSLATKPFRDVTSGSNYLYHTLPGYDLVTGWGSLNADNYYALMLSHAVRFDETGLPADSTWWVNVSGEAGESSTNSSLVIPEPNGTYTYTVASDTAAYSAAGGGFVESGVALPEISVAFSELHASPAALLNPIDAGQATRIQADVSGGSGTYVTYVWQGLPSGCGSPGNVANFTCTPVGGDVADSPYTVSVTATDSDGGRVTGSFELVVDPAELDTVTISRDPVDVGQSTTFTASPSGGGGDYSFSWFGLPSDCGAPGDVAAFNCTPGPLDYLDSPYLIGVQVDDANGFRLISSASLTVDPPLSAGNVSVNPNPVGVGRTTEITVANVSGGTPPYDEYAWNGLPPGCTGATSTFACTPSEVGTFDVTATVTDAAGESASTSIALVVVPTYTVSFSETGLPAGAAWSVGLEGGALAGAGPALNASETNGTYAYSIPRVIVGGDTIYLPTPADGNVSVHGTSVRLSVSFVGVPGYRVSFFEQGLPPGESWSVATPQGAQANVTERSGRYPNSQGSVTLLEPAGALGFAIGPPGGYGLASISGPEGPNATRGTVTGNVSWRVVFGVLETLHFYEAVGGGSSLYSGASWSVELLPAATSGGPLPVTNSTNGTAVSFRVPAGALYEFEVSGPGPEYRVVPDEGRIHISSRTSDQKAVRFRLLTETVIFQEHGLPLTGTYRWAVELVNGSTPAVSFPFSFESRPGAGIEFKLPIGTYHYTVFSPEGETPTQASGTFTVTAAPSTAQRIPVTFT